MVENNTYLKSYFTGCPLQIEFEFVFKILAKGQAQIEPKLI